MDARKRTACRFLAAWMLPPVVMGLVAVAWYGAVVLRWRHLDDARQSLRAQAGLALAAMESMTRPWERDAIDPLCDRLGEATGTRFTVVQPLGRVIGDSERDPVTMDNHADRPEIVGAVQAGTGTEARFSNTVREHMLYFARRVGPRGAPEAVIRTAVPLAPIQAELARLRLRLLGVTLLAVLPALFGVVLLGRRIASACGELEHAARSLVHAGETVPQARVVCSEMVQADAAVRSLARGLHERIQALEKEKRERDALLNSMSEGVVVVDDQERILHCNPAAMELLALQKVCVENQRFSAVVRSSALLELVHASLEEGAYRRTDIEFEEPVARVLRAASSPIHGDQEEQTGAVVLLSDVTAVRQAERIRKDFVTSVSHELRTPVTAIQGFAETLLDDAGDLSESQRHFVEILVRNARSLSTTLDDLLALAAMEYGRDAGGIGFAPVPLSPLVDDVIATCQQQADKRRIRLEADCDEAAVAWGHDRLLELAVVNLVQNAIRYSAEDELVWVAAKPGETMVVVEVHDRGRGIPEQEVPRIFERFYRVDKSRNRAEGGTGLGLAIVKHIANLHNGSIEVDSAVGEGSVFRLSIPKSQGDR